MVKIAVTSSILLKIIDPVWSLINSGATQSTKTKVSFMLGLK